MPIDPRTIDIYHITDVNNLASIIAARGLHSDAAMIRANVPTTAIGYTHIKQRRLDTIRVTCCGNRFVGEFVPFYLCPRSPMLCVVNGGRSGRPQGCQKDIVHLVSTVASGIQLGRPWAVSDGNAGAAYASFGNTLAHFEALDWEIIESNSWGGERLHKKQSEFLVADFFPWTSFVKIGCYNQAALNKVQAILQGSQHQPRVRVEPNWYY
ncbi:type II toxin-antitoxin system toxin DNA ADP-ribosyl transferase DarT [Herbaspirillum aquaticum]|uniref:DarT domain-containing protein n=1 Tax=Herbaspirillum aquaticum TaxID=568783 RepID=A0A225SS94_9BURK|nr:DUF4433 domain-containing protein [Herbaspirillum aquaticum]OWY33704.1 hypothetical protein CEJ45_15140 [Herbaspirillum aquaticum]